MPHGKSLVAAAAARESNQRKPRQPRRLIALASALVVMFAACPVTAQDWDWTGNKSTDWTDARNWNRMTVPSGTNVFIDTKSQHPTVLGVAGADSGQIINLTVGVLGDGDLTIQTGSRLTVTGSAGIARNGGTSVVTVTGAGSLLSIAGGIAVGNFGTGTLNVSNGGHVSITGNAFVGNQGSAVGSVMITDAGSLLTIGQPLRVGVFATGTLTVQNSAQVVAQSGTIVAEWAGSTGTLNIGAKPGNAAVAPGTLNTAAVTFGAGTGTINFNHTSSDYMFAPPIAGNGKVNVLAGTTIFDTDHTYTGSTTISGGTLLVNGSIQSPTTVEGVGTLGGNGFIFNGVDNFGNVAPGNSIGDLHIMGPYVGFGGTLTIESVLAGNGSPIDHLFLDGPTASATGTTNIQVVPLNGNPGPGGLTTGNGIAVVIATGGATTTTSAFHLAGPVAAGPFQYLLFRGPQGAGTADEQNTWYLRSHTDPDGEGGSPPIPLYRPETASYALFPALARGLAVSTIGSFHERNGDQALAAGSKRERMWGRIFGERIEQSHGGHVTPSFEGYAAGFQAGADAYETVWENGMRGRAGVFVGWAEARGDIKGFVLGQLQAAAGDAQLEATSVGGYGTLIGPGGWYIDGIVMPSFYSGDGRSTNGIGVNADGWSLLGSLEAGIPFRIGGGFTLEPQAQLIYQHLSFDDAADPFSTVRFNTPDAVSGRIGVRLAGGLAQGRVRPYLKANLWQDWLDKDGVIYAGTHRLDTEHGGTAVEVGGGVVAELMPGVGLWGVIDYTSDIAGDTERETWRGNAGVRITW